MSPLDWSHKVTDIPADGRHFTREATADERAAVAVQLNIVSCESLSVGYTIRPSGRGRYVLEGPARADVTQACVVSLEPIAARLILPLDIVFAPEDTRPQPDGEEIEVSALPEVETIEHGMLDVGKVVFETLAAGLDPYPKKPDAAFVWDGGSEPSTSANPFAVLAKLRKSDPD